MTIDGGIVDTQPSAPTVRLGRTGAHVAGRRTTRWPAALVPVALAVVAGCSSPAVGGTASPAPSAVPTTSAAPPSTPPPATTSADPTTAATPQNRTGDIRANGDPCAAFTLDAARQVLPELPDQQIDHGDGNCTYFMQPDMSSGDYVSFVAPHTGDPQWAATAQAHNAASGTATPMPVGDGGFCLDMGSTFMIGWQRGSTGLEVDAGGSDLTCDTLTALARTLNASL